jgi:hypothetical protein
MFEEGDAVAGERQRVDAPLAEQHGQELGLSAVAFLGGQLEVGLASRRLEEVRDAIVRRRGRGLDRRREGLLVANHEEPVAQDLVDASS